jgi:hypothetical protein
LHSNTNWAYFSKNLIKKIRQLTEISEKEKKLFERLDYDYKLSEYENPSVVPGFTKKSLQPYAFIARHSDPKGLFQVLKKGATRYFLSLTTQPMRVFRENNEL